MDKKEIPLKRSTPVKRDKPTARVILKYILLQIPDILLALLVLLFLRRWFQIPEFLFWGILLVWVAKDVVLFPFLWRSYAGEKSPGVSAMAGRLGVAKERLDPSGYIQIKGELWQAELAQGGPPVEPGEKVRVREVRGLILLVERA
jgi:membrane protein implicated in regulation of membrane protease activity